MNASSLSRALALTALVLGGCATTPLAEFRPMEGPPLCKYDSRVVKEPRIRTEYSPTFMDASTWSAVDGEIRALARDLATGETEPPLVLDVLRQQVRILAEDDGCIVSFQEDKAQDYALECGELSPEREATRARLEGAVRRHVPALLRLGKSRACTNGPLRYGTLGMNAATAARGGKWSVEMFKDLKAGASLQTGCAYGHTEPCARACERGNPAACNIWVSGLSPADPKRAEIQRRECDLRVKKGEPNRGGTCFTVLSALQKSDRKAAGTLLDGWCAVDPSDPTCQMYALRPQEPLYDAARAKRVVAALDACTGPRCRKGIWLLDPALPTYDPKVAARTLAWLAERCAAHEYGCVDVSARALPHLGEIDRGQASAVVAELEKGCSGEAVFHDLEGTRALGKNELCGPLFHSVASGPLQNAGRAAALATAMCEDPATPNCMPLATCHGKGWCGMAKDEAAAKAAFKPGCSWELAHGVTRDVGMSCGIVDGRIPLDFRK